VYLKRGSIILKGEKMDNWNLQYCEEHYAEYERFYGNGEDFRSNIKEKILLTVESRLFFPFANKINGKVMIWNDKFNWNERWEGKGREYKIRTPLPNKALSVISAKNGRKCCNLGVPFYFVSDTEKDDDGFDDAGFFKILNLRDVCRISQEWQLSNNLFYIFNNHIRIEPPKNEPPIYHFKAMNKIFEKDGEFIYDMDIYKEG
jgi:hypothetical protein